MDSIFNGPVGYIASVALIIIFINSFGWKKDIKAQVNPDEELGKAAKRFFRMLNKKEENG